MTQTGRRREPGKM